MPAAHRLNDANDAGAAITSIAQGTVYINNLLASIDGSSVAGHGVGEHSSPTTTNGSGTVFIGGIPVNRQGDADTCGDSRAAGSPNVFYNDGRLGAASSISSNATGSGTPPVIEPPNISNTAVVAANAAVISAILKSAFIAPPAAGLPFNNDLNLNDESASMSNIVEVPGTNLLSPKLAATGQAWYTLKITEAMTKDGELPEEKILPFGGDDA